MKVFMYYETDGDAGYYHIRLFSKEEDAESYKKEKNDGYGEVKEITVNEKKLRRNK